MMKQTVKQSLLEPTGVTDGSKDSGSIQADGTLTALYGIGVVHPPDWDVVAKFQEGLAWEDGTYRIHAHEGKPLSVYFRWKKHEDPGIEEIVKEIEDEMKKRFKNLRGKKGRRVKVNGHLACVSEFCFAEKQSIFPGIGRRERLRQLHLALYCPQTRRRVIACITTEEDNFTRKRRMIEEILFSLVCH